MRHADDRQAPCRGRMGATNNTAGQGTAEYSTNYAPLRRVEARFLVVVALLRREAKVRDVPAEGAKPRKRPPAIYRAAASPIPVRHGRSAWLSPLAHALMPRYALVGFGCRLSPRNGGCPSAQLTQEHSLTSRSELALITFCFPSPGPGGEHNRQRCAKPPKRTRPAGRRSELPSTGKPTVLGEAKTGPRQQSGR